MNALRRWLLALGGGLAWALCFGREPLLLAPWVALTPLILLLGQPGAVASGFAHGLTFWLVSIPWIVPTLERYGQLSGWLAILSLIALACYLALFHALFAALGARLWRRHATIALLALPALWVAVEWLRGHLFTGFPWNLAAYSWIAVPGALPLSAYLGAYGVSYAVVLASVATAASIAARTWRPMIATFGLLALALALATRWPGVSGSDPEPGDAVSVRVLQPNIGVSSEWNENQIESDYQKIFELSRRACDDPAALVIWPESAAWPYSFARHERLRRDLRALTENGCPVLMNTSMTGPRGVFNSVLLLRRGEVAARYDKRHLVPFGEYVPLNRWLPFLRKIARNAGDFLTGESVEPMIWRNQRLGSAICFEVTFAEEVAEQVRRGATLLVTVTNDAWYGDSWAPWQHLRAARFRAAENRRHLLRAAITGVSAIVSPDGSVEQQLGVGAEGVLAGRVRSRSSLSPFSRAPWASPATCTLVAAFAIFSCRKGRKR